MSKTKNSKKPEYRLYVDYDEYRTGGQICPGEEDDSFPNHEDEYVEVHFNGVYRSMDARGAPFFYDSVTVPKEIFEASTAFLVVVRYETGSTFGRSFGNWHIVDIFGVAEDAKKIAKSIEDDTYRPNSYKPWKGHFDRFEGVEVHRATIEDTYSGKLKKTSAVY